VVYIVYPLTNTALIDQPEGRFSPYSENYDDLSDFKDNVESMKIKDENDQLIADYDVYSIVASPTILNGPDVEPEKSIYIGVGLERKYGDDEINALLEFLRNGGKAILADDYGYLSEFARYFRVTYYKGKFFDNEFDRNENFTVVNAKLSVDQFTPYIPDESELLTNRTNNLMLNNLKTVPPQRYARDLPWFDTDIKISDGIWDSDQDGDGRIDEDSPEKGTPIDDDMDKAKSVKDGLDNDHDGLIDEDDPNEGLNEDHLDDDGDWIDLNNNGAQEPMIWRDKNGDGEFTWLDSDDDDLYDLGESEYEDENSKIWNEYISGDYGVDEEKYDGRDNDGDGMIDEDLEGYRVLFNDATGITSQGTRIIAHGGTSDPPSYVNLDNKPGANTPSIDDKISPDDVVDEISSPGSEIQLIVEVLICPNCGGAIDIKTGACRDTVAEILGGDFCDEKYNTKEFNDFGSIIFISDASVFVNDIFELDHLATDDDTNEIYRLDDTGLPVKLPNVEEWENAPVDEISVEDINEATALEESKRNYLVDRTPDGELDYDNKKFSLHIIKYLLPKGGFVYFDESRHYVENEYLIPIYASIHTVTFLTSDPMYSSSIIIIFILLLSFVIVATKTKEKWVHRHNISVFSQRKSLPLVKSSQAERVRWAILNKARMSKGLSPEEFKDLSPAAIDDIIKDQQLIDLVRNPNRTITEEEFKVIIEKTTKFGK
jgi:hypothetical protein